ncbi:MAG: TraB/GumN family protein [Maricaulaceae bacterium]|nr:TraB/GumN family protein [Maricaulaceae bacterium]
MMQIFALLRRAGAGVFAAFVLAVPALAQPAIWRVSHGDAEVHLFGTIHVLPADLDWMTDEIETAFANADQVWFEAPVHDPDAQMRMFQIIQTHGVNPPENPLSARLDDAARERLARLAPQVGLSPSMLEQYRPWMASIALTMAQAMAQGYNPNTGVELVLLPRAAAAGQTLGFFETLEEQISFMAGLSEEAETAMLVSTLEQMETQPDLIERMVDLWAAGDVAGLERMINDSMRDSAPEVYEALLARRNHAWVETIETMLSGSGAVFIAVGAGHMTGPDGVITLLRDNGYAVEGP